MATFETADKARRTGDNAHDIAEIQKIINDYKNGRRIDRQKAAEIIGRLNMKDMAIASFNSPLIPGWVSFQNATDEQLFNNMNITLLYLSGKMTASELKDRIKRDNNNADTYWIRKDR